MIDAKCIDKLSCQSFVGEAAESREETQARLDCLRHLLDATDELPRTIRLDVEAELRLFAQLCESERGNLSLLHEIDDRRLNEQWATLTSAIIRYRQHKDRREQMRELVQELTQALEDTDLWRAATDGAAPLDKAERSTA
jgi:hypothetical protein